MGDKIKFNSKINGVPRDFTGIIEDVNINSMFPYCIKLIHPEYIDGWKVSYININKQQIIKKIKKKC